MNGIWTSENENLIELFNIKEQEFFNSKERKELGWISNGKVKRIIKTPSGKKVLKRYSYLNKENKICYYQKNIFKISKFKTISKELIEYVKLLFFQGFSIKKIEKTINKDNDLISETSIKNIIRKLEVKNKEDNNFKNDENNKENIYIEIDDTFQDLRINNKIQKHKSRLITIHNGLNSKKQVINKTILLETVETNTSEKLSTLELSNIILNKIKEIYGLKNKTLIVIGDGARFIKQIAKNLNAYYVVDNWHILNLLSKLIGFGKNNTQNKKWFKNIKINAKTIYYISKSLIFKNKWKDAINIIQKAIENAQSKFTNDNFKNKWIEFFKFKKYLTNNKTGLNNYLQKFYIGSRTEIFVSNIIKKFTKRKTLIGLNLFQKLILFNRNEEENLIFINK